MTDLFVVCWTLLASTNVACTGMLPTYREAVEVAHDVHPGLSAPCVRRIVYTDERPALVFRACP